MMAIKSAGFSGQENEIVRKQDYVSLLVDADSNIEDELSALQGEESIEKLSDSIYSAYVTLDSAAKMNRSNSVRQLQTKKKKSAHINEATSNAGLHISPNGNRTVTETGKNVLIGIVDTGFDLSHPMFLDSNGHLRVKGLLDQTTGNHFTTNQLNANWTGLDNPAGPGGDLDGHGTHVASIAGGTKFNNFEGVAPDAQFLLVKTDFTNTDKAVSWIFQQAAGTPCVVNMSLGHHWGAHDGSDQEERLHETLTGPGKLIVVSAGNERNDRIHIGGRFVNNQTESVSFRVFRQQQDPPFAVLTLWYDSNDDFEFFLLTPSGQVLAVPKPGNATNYSNSLLDLELAHVSGSGTGGNSGKVQIIIDFASMAVQNQLLSNWAISVRCNSALIGRLDGWFNNSGYAEFDSHPLVETTRTLGLPSTGNGCISVASHVSRNTWNSDDGPQLDSRVIIGRSSSFSSQGPTRDARQKPEISAPGQYLVAALADNSDYANLSERADTNNRFLSIEGTSMSAPMVTGAVALMLQKKQSLTPQQAINALTAFSTVDGHTSAVWNPAYGHGKLDIAKIIANI